MTVTASDLQEACDSLVLAVERTVKICDAALAGQPMPPVEDADRPEAQDLYRGMRDAAAGDGPLAHFQLSLDLAQREGTAEMAERLAARVRQAGAQARVQGTVVTASYRPERHHAA